MQIQRLIERCREGDETAEVELVCYYISRVSLFAEKRISSLYTRRFDGDDVANSVMKSLMLRIRAGAINSDDEWMLWSLLMTMTRRKVARKIRQAQQDKRDIRREFQPQGTGCDSDFDIAEFVKDSSNATFDDSAILLEEAIVLVEKSKPGLEAPSHREILLLCMQGYSYKEICDRLKARHNKNFSLKIIQRRLGDIRQSIEQLNRLDEADDLTGSRDDTN